MVLLHRLARNHPGVKNIPPDQVITTLHQQINNANTKHPCRIADLEAARLNTLVVGKLWWSVGSTIMKKSGRLPTPIGLLLGDHNSIF